MSAGSDLQTSPPAEAPTPNLIHPFRKRWSGAVVVTVTTGVPVFATLYFLAALKGDVVGVIGLQVVLSAAIFVTINRARIVEIAVSRLGMSEQELFLKPRAFTPASKIAQVLVINVLDTSDAGGTRHLFVIDAGGKRLHRLRGQVWSADSMRILINALEVPTKIVEDPMSTATARREYGHLIYAYERYPLAAITLVCLLGILLATPIYLYVGSLI